MKRKIIIRIAAVGAAVCLVVLFSWVVVSALLDRTSDEEFCSSCHTMTPFVESYKQDVHGGNNSTGIKAKCTGCHLPHDGDVHYLYVKSLTGFNDVYAQLTSDFDEIDWQKKREHRETYVFDSGCVNCHNNLQASTMRTPKAFVAHKAYFQRETDKGCVSCHETAGHKDLSMYIATNNPNREK